MSLGSQGYARQTAMREKRTMHTNHIKAILNIAARVLAILSFATAAYGQTINLTAGPTAATMPDGTVVPMWGYFCKDAGTGASCATLKVPSTATPATWVASIAYVVGQAILDGAGNVQVTTTLGKLSILVLN